MWWLILSDKFLLTRLQILNPSAQPLQFRVVLCGQYTAFSLPRDFSNDRQNQTCCLLENVMQTAQWYLVISAFNFELARCHLALVSQVKLFICSFYAIVHRLVNRSAQIRTVRIQDVLFSQVMCLAQEREEPRGTGRCSGTTSKELPSQQSGDWLAVEVSSVFLDWSMRRLEASSRCSWRMSSGMQSPTLSMLAARPWQHLMLSMPSRDRAEPCTDLEDNFLHSTHTTPGDLNHHQLESSTFIPHESTKMIVL